MNIITESVQVNKADAAEFTTRWWNNKAKEPGFDGYLPTFNIDYTELTHFGLVEKALAGEEIVNYSINPRHWFRTEDGTKCMCATVNVQVERDGSVEDVKVHIGRDRKDPEQIKLLKWVPGSGWIAIQ